MNEGHFSRCIYVLVESGSLKRFVNVRAHLEMDHRVRRNENLFAKEGNYLGEDGCL